MNIIKCPYCGEEVDTEHTAIMCSNPPQIDCKKCGKRYWFKGNKSAKNSIELLSEYRKRR